MKLNWIPLQQEDQLSQINNLSHSRLQVIFKHSTRCSISAVAKNRLENANAPSEVDFYYLDLIKNRNLSGLIEQVYNIQHESPQVIIVKNNDAIYNESHLGISMDEIAKFSAKTNYQM